MGSSRWRRVLCVGHGHWQIREGQRAGPLWLHPRWVPVGPSRVSAVASVFLVVGGGWGPLPVGVPATAPSHVFLKRNPCGERQKHNQKCSSKKKRHNGSRQTFLAKTFPAGLQAHPWSPLSSAAFQLNCPALPGSVNLRLHHHVTEPEPSAPIPVMPHLEA